MTTSVPTRGAIVTTSFAPFNSDKPYNEFVIEQIAGDELWEQQPEEKRNPELLAASLSAHGPVGSGHDTRPAGTADLSR